MWFNTKMNNQVPNEYYIKDPKLQNLVPNTAMVNVYLGGQSSKTKENQPEPDFNDLGLSKTYQIG